MININDFLRRLLELKGSDIHFKVDSRPMVRVDGQLSIVEDTEPLTESGIQELFSQVTTPQERELFAAELELDFSYADEKLGRFRFSAYQQRGSICMACRQVQTRIPTIEELGLPDVCKRMALIESGLILICGPSGSGKSTTLAAIIGYMNQNTRRNIITIEDPIEYVHKDILCSFSQRQVGTDTKSFNIALRQALRQDPDVILMGEIRDLDTIATTLTAAETGHLVLTTLHASNAIQALDRITDVFPAHQQDQVRLQLATTMRGILFQQLIPRIDCPGRVAAVEVLLESEAISNLIRTKKNYQIMNVIQSSSEAGMQSLDNVVFNLLNRVSSAGIMLYYIAPIPRISWRNWMQGRARNPGWFVILEVFGRP
jgi:twitching motility protein PilT